MLLFTLLALTDEKTRSFMEKLYWEYRKLVYYKVLKIVSNPWDAEDIVQTVFVSLVEKADLLQTLDRNRLISYIITTAKNTTYSYLRKEKRKIIISFDEQENLWSNELVSPDTTDSALLKEATAKELSLAWSKLDEKNQWLLEGRYIEGYTNEYIAEELGIKFDSVRMLLSRARQKLKKVLQNMNFHI